MVFGGPTDNFIHFVEQSRLQLAMETKNKQQYFYSPKLRKSLEWSWCRNSGLYERTQTFVLAMTSPSPLCIHLHVFLLPHASAIRACDCFFNHQISLDVRLTLTVWFLYFVHIFLVSHVDKDLTDGCNPLEIDALLYPVFFDKYDLLLLRYLIVFHR